MEIWVDNSFFHLEKSQKIFLHQNYLQRILQNLNRYQKKLFQFLFVVKRQIDIQELNIKS